MKILVTGSSGHLGEALVRTLQGTAHALVTLDRTESPFTGNTGLAHHVPFAVIP